MKFAVANVLILVLGMTFQTFGLNNVSRDILLISVMMFTSFIVQLVIVLIVLAAFETIEAGPLLEQL